ncbi:ATP-binding protein [Hymenobacter properus]|uniref:ATP-binding protein n=1 Tax=Hymenobacter properus TaxID=2791026 RepID=A0A931FK65_9BACT|nr:ATP-binding protein [Hymenobacter properus]MBF9141360.1 ATP-binding protein [Hymenobacter properus]MBR7720170.1 ATP-binding protein [Microvirga sp. SRT04]
MKSSLRIACSRSHLQEVRDFVRTYLMGLDLPEITINQVVLAIDEVVANFIIHANGEDETQFLDLELAVAQHELNVEIADHGDTIFLPGAHQSPDLRAYIKEGRKGGMGMALVNRLMDRVEFFTRGNHTVCHLSKHLA